jgi:glycogen debranching enzyme
MAEPVVAQVPGRPPDGDPHHVLVPSGITDDRTRVLKHGDTFAVLDHLGRIKPGGLGEEGLYHEGTRYLSCLILELDGQPPFFLGSTVRDENDQLSVALTNPDRIRDRRLELPLGTLQLAVRMLLWQGACHWRLQVKNHGSEPVALSICVRFQADFADIFEVRGMKRAARGNDLLPVLEPARVTLGYVGLDAQWRRAVLRFRPAPEKIAADRAEFKLCLRQHEEFALELVIGCSRGRDCLEPPEFRVAESAAAAALERFKARSCRVGASESRFEAWLRRSDSDLHMLTTELPTGPYPYAGVPWFNTPFGRDGIITAIQCLSFRPELSRGVLAYLAATQATELIPAQDAEPGKVLHETRNGEMATCGEMPFGRYYGSVDATPLFVLLAGAYYERTGDRMFAASIWPSVQAALAWIDDFGDRDGDGFVEYERRASDGLIHQGWKDSDDAVSHADGSLASGPIALCEVQAYVYAARQAGAVLAAALGLSDRAASLQDQAEAIRQRFEATFWCDELETYALALDGEKRPCRVRTSNAGLCLFGGIASPERALRVTRGLAAPGMFCGWGIRTLAATEARYNPMGYHNGAVWPHDNAMIAFGAARYGLKDFTARILAGQFAAATYFDLHRMPELFCGFDREPGEGPVPYPVACAPQAWAAGSVFLMIEASLGLTVSGVERQICLHQPWLPSFVPELRITNLEVAGASVDLLLVRHGDDVGVNVLRRVGDLRVVVAK